MRVQKHQPLFWLALGAAAVNLNAQDLPAILGGGNFYSDTTANELNFQALNQLGGKLCRISVGGYYEDGAPTPERYDDMMMQTYTHGISPTILFEYYATDGDLGDYQKWYDIGNAFAKRFAPGGTFSVKLGAPGFGVKVFAAINEPEVLNKIPKDAYKAALEGLADGVHAVNADLKVVPGGYMSANAWDDWSLRGYGTAIAPLLNNGKLDGIDLHTYYDVKFAPMEGGYDNSAQSNFDNVKKTCGITRDISFYTTEFNYKTRIVTEAEAAKGLLTGLWDNFGIVRNDGKSPAARFAMVWNIFNTASTDVVYGLCTQVGPWVPTARGRVLQMFVTLTKEMQFLELDPKGKGEFTMGAPGKKLWVWQNRKGWTNHAGTSMTLKDIPKGATRLDVYGWDGLKKTEMLAGQTEFTVSGLNTEETYMFLATGFTGLPAGQLISAINPSALPPYFHSNSISLRRSLGHASNIWITPLSSPSTSPHFNPPMNVQGRKIAILPLP